MRTGILLVIGLVLSVAAAVRREIGRPLTSADNYTWWLAIDDQAERALAVAGIAAVKAGKTYAELCHAYVLPAFRRRGIYRALLGIRLAHCAGRFPRLKTVATDLSLPALLSAGFARTGHRGRYTTLEKQGHST